MRKIAAVTSGIAVLAALAMMLYGVWTASTDPQQAVAGQRLVLPALTILLFATGVSSFAQRRTAVPVPVSKK